MGLTLKLNNMMQATIDMTGLPDALAIDLKKQMEAMVEKAKADLPISFQDRVDRALYDLPEELGEITNSKALTASLEAELRTHIEKVGFVELVVGAARTSVNCIDDEFNHDEFEYELRRLIGTLFI